MLILRLKLDLRLIIIIIKQLVLKCRWIKITYFENTVQMKQQTEMLWTQLGNS